MTRLVTAMMLSAATALPGGWLAAQGLESGFPNPMHPMEGTLIADLAAVNGAAEGATGRAVFNYVRGRGEVIVNVSVTGLEANKWYQVHVAVHRVKPVADVLNFRTDGSGAGDASVRVECLTSFNLVNVREVGVAGSRRLTSWQEDGGTLQQTPDRRNRETPPESCPGS